MHPQIAQMAESVDALVSNTSGAIRAGSTPALGTILYKTSLVNQKFTRDFLFLGSQRDAKFIISPSIQDYIYHYGGSYNRGYGIQG